MSDKQQKARIPEEMSYLPMVEDILTVSLCLFVLFHNVNMPIGSAKVEDLGGGNELPMFSCLATDPTVAIFVIISHLIICGVARWAGHGYNSVPGEHPQSVRLMHIFWAFLGDTIVTMTSPPRDTAYNQT